MSNSSIKKRTRCKKGTRKNKKTGNCESVLDHTCAICLERIISGNIKTKCKHNFHKKCLQGWCKSKEDLITGAACPICRSNIKDTCKKILPFASHEVFRYTSIGLVSDKRRDYFIEQVNEIVHNKKFDVNVKNQLGVPILSVLSYNQYHSQYFKDTIEYLLKHPKIIVDNNIVSELIASRNMDILALYKKHKKIPKSLKSLM
jgi:hypothetical protein